jgi:WD40 repeat protein
MKKIFAFLAFGLTASCIARPLSTVPPQNATNRILPTANTPAMTPAASSIGMPDTTATFTPGLFPGTTQTATLAGETQTITSANANLVAQLGLLGKGSVVKAKWSPDGQWVAVASTLGIHIYRAQSLEEIRFIDTTFAPNTFDLSPDGKVLAVLVSSLHSGMVAQFWSVPDGSKLKEWPNLEPEIMKRVLQFSPDGSLLAFGTSEGSVVLRRVSDGKVESTVRMHSEMVTGLAFSPDGSLIASVSAEGGSVLWRRWDGRLLHRFWHKFGWSGANCVAFSPDGTKLAFGVSEEV